MDLRKLLFMQQAQNEQNQNNLLSTNQPQSGLLSGLMSDPTARLLIGANLIGAGVKGQDPFSAITPAVLQTAQIQKTLRPKRRALKSAYNPKTGQTVFATEQDIVDKGLTPVPTGTITRFNTETGNVEIVPATQAKIQEDDLTKARNIGTEYNILEGLIGDMNKRLPTTKTGAVGVGFGLIESLADQTSQVAETLGVKNRLLIKDEKAIDNFLESKGFTKAAQDFARMKSSVTNLGYALAKIAEPNNPRLSEGDIIRQLNRINFGGSRDVFAASLDQILKEERMRAETTVKSLGGDISIFGDKKKKKINQNQNQTDQTNYDPLGIL